MTLLRCSRCGMTGSAPAALIGLSHHRSRPGGILETCGHWVCVGYSELHALHARIMHGDLPLTARGDQTTETRSGT